MNTTLSSIVTDKACSYELYCRSLYGGCDINNCHVLQRISEGKIPSFIQDIPKPKCSTQKLEAICPRSSNNITIIDKCSNTDCPYYSSKMSMSCIHIHSDIFLKKDMINLIEQVVGKDRRHIEQVLKFCVYLMRMNVILLHYLFTQEEFNINIDKETLEWIDVSLNQELNISLEMSPEQEAFASYWVDILKRPRYKKTPYDNLSYKEFFASYDNYRDKVKLLRSMLSKIEMEGIRLIDVPFIYLVQAYYAIFGYIDVANFGLSDSMGKKMIQLFL